MTLNTIWKRKAERNFKIEDDINEQLKAIYSTHWVITCWFYEEVGTAIEDEHRAPSGKHACTFPQRLISAASKKEFIWHPREWKHDDNDELQDYITCTECRKRYLDL